MASHTNTESPNGDEQWNRRMFLTGAGAAGAAALAGCLGGSESDSGDGSSESSKLKLLTTYTSSASKRSYNEANDSFKANHENLEIEMGYTSWEKIYNRLVQAARTEDWPDLVFFLDNELNLLLKDQGFIEDPKRLMDAAEESAGKIAADVPETHYLDKDGSFYTMQSNSQSNTTWMRTDVLEAIGEEYPESWNDELRVLKKAHESDEFPNLHGTAISTAKNAYMATVFFSRLRGAGGNALDPEKNVAFDSQVTRDTLEHWNAMAEYGAPGKESFSYGDIYTNFAADKVASCQYWGRTYINVIEQTPDIADKVTTFSHAQPDNDKASPDEKSLMSGDGGQLIKGGENKEAAVEWWKNYVKPEFFVDKFMKGTPGNTVPMYEGHQDAWDEFDVWTDYEHGTEIRDNLVADTRKAHPKCRAGPEFEAFPELANIIKKPVMSGPGSSYFAGNISVDEAAKEMAKKAEQEVANYGSGN
ncbi:ABC transporter substrate-binding protein [Haladaptatus sp. ZSTT2]|uniref:ABC transporter substrate-binding protein n=2 Tax=unclassified Haladaptatus TaxID=2622732 RepID=UPI00300F1818